MYGIWNKFKFQWEFGIEEPTYWKAHKALRKVVGSRDVFKQRYVVKLMQAKARGFKE